MLSRVYSTYLPNYRRLAYATHLLINTYQSSNNQTIRATSTSDNVYFHDSLYS